MSFQYKCIFRLLFSFYEIIDCRKKYLVNFLCKGPLFGHEKSKKNLSEYGCRIQLTFHVL
jgi:hypothetical protein